MKKISPVDVREIAEVAVRVMTENGHANKSYTLTGPTKISYEEAAVELSSALGRKINYVKMGLSDFNQAMIAQGVPAILAERFTDIGAIVVKEGRTK